ncbi:NusG domain II-containing protein [Bacillaceae bacterium S4-13-58]
MKGYLEMIKPFDIIIVITLILMSFLPFAIFTVQQGEAEGTNLVAVIKVENEVIKTIPLTGHEGVEIFDVYPHPDEVNTIEVNGEKIRVKAANCPDQVDVLTGYISRPGETIVCLPHKMVIEIQSDNGYIEDEIIISS